MRLDFSCQPALCSNEAQSSGDQSENKLPTVFITDSSFQAFFKQKRQTLTLRLCCFSLFLMYMKNYLGLLNVGCTTEGIP